MFYGTSITSQHVEPLTREIFERLTQDPTLAGLDWEVGALKDRLADGSKTADEVTERIARNKRKRPYICTSDFDGGRRLNINARWSGFCSLDIDHIDNPMDFYKEHVEGRERELGIVLAFVSPSQQGLKIIFRTPRSIDNATAQASMAKAIEAPFDGSTKDMARATFLVSRSMFRHYDAEAMFTATPEDYALPTPQAPRTGGCGSRPEGGENGKAAGGGKTKAAKNGDFAPEGSQTTSPRSGGLGGRFRAKRPTKRVMMIMEVGLRVMGASRKALEVEGQRHQMLVNLMSSGVARLLSREEFLGGYKRIVPRYAKTDEAHTTIAYFYEHYTQNIRLMSADTRNAFRQVMNIDDEGRPYETPQAPHVGGMWLFARGRRRRRRQRRKW